MTYDPYTIGLDNIMFKVRQDFYTSMAVTPTVPETDPGTWHRPRGFRAVLRRMTQIIGYEYRKEAERPRKYLDRKHFAVIKNIVNA